MDQAMYVSPHGSGYFDTTTGYFAVYPVTPQSYAPILVTLPGQKVLTQCPVLLGQ